ncbi:MAG: MraY family glycosyltransferase [Candidatus Cloacimonetes bacterium]|nr:MraY family glycosyltransferase [Candidatus Cloacimonadota bacterium]
MIYEYMITFIMTFLLVYSITPYLIKFAYKINFVDNPNHRKVHKKATPLLGGVAVFTGFFLFTIYNVLMSQFRTFDISFIGYLAGALIIVVVGVIDDKFGMKPMIKMIGQTTACLVFIFSNNLSGFLGSIYITVPIILLWMVGLMNAFNFLDNMDGILSGMSGILAIGFYSLGMMVTTPAVAFQSNFIALLSITFAGAVLGFLPHNFNPAKIFLGDAGSMFIGYFLSTLGILSGKLLINSANSKLYLLFPILLLSYAIFDISLVSYTRKRDGRKISEGGKDHSTHRIDNAVGSCKLTAILVYIINIVIVLLTIIIFQVNSKILLIISSILFSMLFLFLGRKLDKIPVTITQNQLRSKKTIAEQKA